MFRYYEVFASYLDNVLPDKEEQTVRCIFHDDTTPSLSINLEKGLFYCHACHAKGNIDTFWRMVGETNPQKSLEELVERYHLALLRNPRALYMLARQKSITEEVITHYKVGYDELSGRYSLPVYDVNGKLVGIRKYKLNAIAQKVVPIGNAYECFPADSLTREPIVLVEGEIDALCVISAGLAGLTLTPPSAVSYIDRLSDYFKEKHVVIITDNDETGRKLAREYDARLRAYTEYIKHVSTTPYKDVCHLVAESSYEKLLERIKEAPHAKEPIAVEEHYAYLPVSEMVDVKRLNNRYSTEFYCSARSVHTYVAPMQAVVYCNPIYNFCKQCGKKDETVSFSLQDNQVPLVVDASRENLRALARRHFGIPARCQAFEIVPQVQQTIAVGYATNRLDESTHFSLATPMRFYVLGDKDTLEANRMYSAHVTVVTSDRNNEVVGIARDLVPLHHTLDYNLSPTMYDFAPTQKQSVFEKLMDISEDLEVITNVNERRALLMAIDLVFHSPLRILYDNRDIKGYLDILVIGDTRTGKSKAIEGLVKFYRMGVIVDGGNTTVAGLIGGIISTEDVAMVAWGILPQNDCGLVVIDEADELSGEVIERLSYVRSTGIAEQTKVRQCRTNARVRLIMVTNPPRSMELDNYTYPILAVPDFVASKQDIARFDYAVIVKGPVSSIRVQPRPLKHNVDDYINLVKLAWSLKPSDIVYTFDMDTLLQYCRDIAERYISDIPLVESNSFYEKALRIATAVACRTFSYDMERQKLVVTEEHLKFVSDFIDYLYGEISGYRAYCQDMMQTRVGYDVYDIASTLSLLVRPEAFLKNARYLSTFSKQQMHDIVGSKREEFDEFFACLLRNNLVRRLSNGLYTKTYAFFNAIEEALKIYKKGA